MITFAPPARAAEVIYVPTVTLAPTSTSDMVDYYAVQYSVSASSMRAVIQCESQFQNIQSRIPHTGQPNDREDSWGLVQIYLPAHKDITRDQALDPDFAIEWMAKMFSLGKQRMWTCARTLGYANPL